MTTKLRLVADNADVIVNGYAFKRDGDRVSVLNLNKPDCAVFMTLEGDILETSMDDIELEIVRGYLRVNRKYMEA